MFLQPQMMRRGVPIGSALQPGSSGNQVMKGLLHERKTTDSNRSTLLCCSCCGSALPAALVRPERGLWTEGRGSRYTATPLQSVSTGDFTVGLEFRDSTGPA